MNSKIFTKLVKADRGFEFRTYGGNAKSVIFHIWVKNESNDLTWSEVEIRYDNRAKEYSLSINQISEDDGRYITGLFYEYYIEIDRVCEIMDKLLGLFFARVNEI